MNDLLKKQVEKFLDNRDIKPDDVNAFIGEIDTTYSQYEQEIQELKSTLQENPKELTMMNQQLTQNIADQRQIIDSLKKAIAELEPESPILTAQSSSSLDEMSYLTESLIRLIESQKQSQKELETQKLELEDVNKLLVTERNLLSEAQAKDQAILLAIGDGLIVTDKFGNIVLVNYFFQQLLGWSVNEAIGKNINTMVKKFDHLDREIDQERRLYHLAITTGKRYSTPPDVTYFYERKDGSKFPVSITVAPIKLKNEIIGSVEIFKDVTKEKEIDRAKSEFVSLASHQLRTPLSSINWYTELLLEGELAEKMKEENIKYIQEIARANARMVAMVNALLNVSRIELGTFAIEPETINIIDVAEEVVSEITPLLETKKVTLTKSYSQDIPSIMADPNLLSMIFQNLLTNAIKYSPEGSSVKLEISIPTNREVQIMIEDNGLGIPKQEHEKIFTKLFRASNVLKIDTDGNGLGLYIAKAIVTTFGGRIWFESEEDKGSKFYFSVPISGMQKKSGAKRLSHKS